MASINEAREKLRKEIQDLFRNLFLERDGLSPIDLQPEKLQSFSRLAAELAKKTSELELLLSVTEEVKVVEVEKTVFVPEPKPEVVEAKPVTPVQEVPVISIAPKVEPKIETQVSPPSKKFIDVKTIIGFNERLMFLSHLFNRDANAYENAISQINACNSLEEATAFLSVVSAEYKWNSQSEPVFIFNSIVKRRFA